MLKKCVICGKEFEAQSVEKLWCSRSCYGKLWRKNHPVEKTKEIGVCIICGKEFEKRRADHRFCSVECRRANEKVAVKGRTAKHKEKKKQEMIKEAVRLAKKSENHDAIADIAIKARSLGMSYGQYVAKYMGRM